MMKLKLFFGALNDKALTIDGLNTFFNKIYWDIVEADII